MAGRKSGQKARFRCTRDCSSFYLYLRLRAASDFFLRLTEGFFVSLSLTDLLDHASPCALLLKRRSALSRDSLSFTRISAIYFPPIRRPAGVSVVQWFTYNTANYSFLEGACQPLSCEHFLNLSPAGKTLAFPGQPPRRGAVEGKAFSPFSFAIENGRVIGTAWQFPPSLPMVLTQREKSHLFAVPIPTLACRIGEFGAAHPRLACRQAGDELSAPHPLPPPALIPRRYMYPWWRGRGI